MTPEDRVELLAAGHDPDDPAVVERMQLASIGLALIGQQWRRAGLRPSHACLDQASRSAST